MLRFLIVIIFVILFLVLSLPVLLIEWIVGKFDKHAKDVACQKIIQTAFKFILWFCGTKLDVYGEENLPTDTPALYVGNHRSIFDILIFYTRVKSLTGIISKKEMNIIPIFNIWMRNINCYFLDRENIKDGLKMVLYAIDSIKKGIGILIFPEGTRNKEEGSVLPFKGGSFKIAEKSKCDVVPFAIINSAAIFENHKPALKSSHVILVIGKPIKTADFTKDDFKELPDKAREEVIRLHNSKVDEL